MRVLLVEDEKNFGLVLKNELSQEAYDVEHVGDGVEAVLRFLSDRHDMVLMDLRLPKLQGIDAIRIIKAMSPSTPVIAFSGHADDLEKKAAADAGAMCCLTKPFEVFRLKEEMGKLLSAEGGEADG
jgi:DNA-binding response OmpR family regulator